MAEIRCIWENMKVYSIILCAKKYYHQLSFVKSEKHGSHDCIYLNCFLFLYRTIHFQQMEDESKESTRDKGRKCHMTAQGRPISFARAKAWPKLGNIMNKWHALFHMDLLWLSLFLLTSSFSCSPSSQRHACTNGSFWNKSRVPACSSSPLSVL